MQTNDLIFFLQSAAYPETLRSSTYPFKNQMLPARDGSHQKPTWRAFSALQHPCKEPGCNRWFRNLSGLTQHKRTIHPSFSQYQQHLPARAGSLGPLGQEYHDAAPVTDHDLNRDSPDRDGHQDGPLDQEHENMRAEFVGPGSKLYRNYHPGLNGMFVDSLTSTNNFYFSAKMRCEWQFSTG